MIKTKQLYNNVFIIVWNEKPNLSTAKLWQWILHGGSFCGITDVGMMGKYFLYQDVRGGRGIVVGIVTGYGLDRPQIKSQWRRGFLCLSRPAPRSTSLLYNGYWVFPRGKVAEVWCWLPTPSGREAAMGWSYSSASPLWLHRHVMEWPLPLSVSEPWLPTVSHHFINRAVSWVTNTVTVKNYRELQTVFCNTGLFEMIVGVLAICHTQHTWDRSICIFLFNRTTLQVFVTYLIDALYVHPLWFYKHQHDNRVRSKLFVACQRWWFQWRFRFVPSVPGYLREEEEHKPLKNTYTPISSVFCMTRC